MRGLLPLVCSACVPPGFAETSAFDPDLPPPAITTLDVSCDLDEGRWRVEVRTDAWAGGGSVLWSEDGAYVEQHDGLRSVRAAEDGSADLLRLDIAVITDFRQTRSGLTLFTCNAQPSALVWVEDLDGQIADCRQVGDAAAPLLERPEGPPCPDALP